MPRKTNRQNRKLPAYSLHKATGQAYVRLTIDGKRKAVYLGVHNSRESLERYDKVVGDWMAHRPLSEAKQTGPTIRDLAERFESYAARRKDFVKAACRILTEMFGDRPVSEFGAGQFERLKAGMVKKGWSRSYANEVIGYAKKCFRFGMQHELVTANQFVVISSIELLSADDAPTKDVQPVEDWIVEETIPALSKELQDLVRFIRWTGCRPGEARTAKVSDVDHENWLMELKHHKTAHRGKCRFIAIPAAAKALILPRLLRPAGCYLFSAEASYTRPFERRVLGRAVKRALTRINRERKKEGIDLLPHWHPYQLRHTRSTEVREQYDAEVAQVLLGSSKIDMAQHYAQLTRKRAADLAKQLG